MSAVPAPVSAAAVHPVASQVAALHPACAASAVISHAPAWMPRWLVDGWPADYLPPLVALVVFLWTLIAFLSAKRRERFKLGIDLIMKLGERFESSAIRQHRAAAALALRKGSKGEVPGLNAVLDFFEEIAFLEHRGALDLEAVFEFFAYWIEIYARASAQHRIERREANDPLVWEGFEHLWKAIECFDHWTTSDDVPRWQPRILHDFRWRHGLGRDLSKSWSAPDESTDSDLHQEQLLLETVLPGAWRPRRVKCIRRCKAFLTSNP